MAERGLRERKKADTRSALADATLRLAADRGWEQVTVEAITDAAGVSYRTFFNHFSAKEEALLLPGGDDQPRLSARLRDQPADIAVLDAVRAALHDELADLETDPGALRNRMTVVLGNPSLLPRLVEMGATDERELAQAIAERTGQDVEADLHPALLAAVLSATVRVVLGRWHLQDGATPLTTLADEALRALAGGLPAPPPAG
ncbi:TetR/AcrR family transcriptional regulator [Modestobacter lapidis]|nr:TetR family transcriptional regulator [Modestobacter lapidis]